MSSKLSFLDIETLRADLKHVKLSLTKILPAYEQACLTDSWLYSKCGGFNVADITKEEQAQWRKASTTINKYNTLYRKHKRLLDKMESISSWDSFVSSIVSTFFPVLLK